MEIQPIVPRTEILSRMDHVQPVIVIDEEIAVSAVVETGQDALDLFLRGLVIRSCPVIDRADRRKGKIGEVKEFSLLCREHVSFERIDARARQRHGLPRNQRCDDDNRKNERPDGQCENLAPEFHAPPDTFILHTSLHNT